ncbi:MAG TPA: helix-turn-helix domain-containing protein [Chloroflexota bacterium]|nr:helix-turn-helix domain-containing protein [Chloroflexota bacterium]
MMTAVASRTPPGRPPEAPHRRSTNSLCLLCGSLLERASVGTSRTRGVCGGCAERLELELTCSDHAACGECGRHQELCAVMPCSGPSQPPPAPKTQTADATPGLALIENLQRRQVSGAERVRAIERLAATHLGVRELGRRTGFAPSTISRWLKIDRCPQLKHALESEVLDIGRAKLLADAPVTALAELIPQAAACSRADLARRVAALRGRGEPAVDVLFSSSADSRRLLKAVHIVESVDALSATDRATLERLSILVSNLLQS